MRPFALLAFLVAAPALAQPALGETSFANSGAQEAQAPFLRGLLLLHSFEYDDAREAFQQARRIDPDFAMAAWGEAMTHNHPVWQRQDLDAAREALQTPPVSSITDRERAYLATVAVLFGEGEKEDRDDAYALAMADLARAYPDDLDARALYALALLGTAHEGRDFATYMQAAAVAEEVFDENPRHPGAAHYLIHAYDDPVHAPLGLRPARVYDGIAPAASHALHMPSHIYLALGLWHDVEEMNRRSFEAAKAGTDRRGDALNGHGWHALWWRHYAALQLGDTDLATSLYHQALALAGDAPDATALAHVQRMRAQHFVLTGDADVLVFGDAYEAPDNVFDGFVNGLVITGTGDPAYHQRALDDLRALLDEQPSWWERASVSILEGQVLVAEGDVAGAEAAFQAAARLEAEAPLAFGPPSPALMAHEALGTFLLDQGRPAEAAAAFRAALDRAPKRRQTEEALARAEAGPPTGARSDGAE